MQGSIVLDLLADAAPTHVAHFITQARAGAYDGTVFHRVIAMGIIQGGDPLSKDPAQSAKYGTGGLGRLRFEANAEKHTSGAVSAVLVPGNRDSAGNQFFIVVTDQPALDGQYTVFARVVDGINVAQKISTTPATNTVPAARIEIRNGDRSATSRRRSQSRSCRASVEELRSYRRGADDLAWRTSRSSCFPTVRRITSGSSCGWLRPASTTARRFTASCKGFVAQTAICPRGESR